MSLLQRTTAHYMRHWGPPTNVHQQAFIGDDAFAVMEFPPSERVAGWRYATNGMGGREHSKGVMPIRTELYCSTSGRADWCGELLHGIARYPFENNTGIVELDTIPMVGAARAAIGAAITFVPPANDDEESLWLIPTDPGYVYVWRVVKMTETEYEQVLDGRSMDDFWSSLEASGYPLHLDVERPSV